MPKGNQFHFTLSILDRNIYLIIKLASTGSASVRVEGSFLELAEGPFPELVEGNYYLYPKPPTMKAYMYILQCSDGSYYTGSTKDLDLRLEQHMSGKGANFTKNRLPVKLVYFEEFDRIDDAYYREKQIQKWTKRKKTALINGDFDLLKILSSNSKNKLSNN